MSECANLTSCAGAWLGTIVSSSSLIRPNLSFGNLQSDKSTSSRCIVLAARDVRGRGHPPQRVHALGGVGWGRWKFAQETRSGIEGNMARKLGVWCCYDVLCSFPACQVSRFFAFIQVVPFSDFRRRFRNQKKRDFPNDNPKIKKCVSCQKR